MDYRYVKVVMKRNRTLQHMTPVYTTAVWIQRATPTPLSHAKYQVSRERDQVIVPGCFDTIGWRPGWSLLAVK